MCIRDRIRGGAIVSSSSSYANTDVDSHLNQNNPTSGHVLSWNGSDSARVTQSGGDTPGVQSFTASEAISNGEVVSLLTNGQIASIGNTTLAAGTTAFASLPEVTDGDDYNNDWGKVVYDAGTGYFVA